LNKNRRSIQTPVAAAAIPAMMAQQQQPKQPKQAKQACALPLSPALTSLQYDYGAYKANLAQSVGPAHYMLAPYAMPNCQNCVETDPRVAMGKSGAALCGAKSGVVDVESDLHNLTRPATLSPDGLYRGDGGPPVVCGGVPGAGLTARPDCKGIPTVDTRLINPPCTLRGTGWNRWEWLCRNPQDNALMPFDARVDTSLVIKDNHRPALACPLDPSLALPPGCRDVDPAVGAPEWRPSCPSTAGGTGGGLPLGPVGDTPLLLWRTCAEVGRM
jgi:hypothetical protein